MLKSGIWTVGLCLTAVFFTLLGGFFLFNMENPRAKSVEHVIYQIDQNEGIKTFEIVDDTATVTLEKYDNNDAVSMTFTKKISVKGITDPVIKVYYSFDGGKTKYSYNICPPFDLYHPERATGVFSFRMDSNGTLWPIREAGKN
jgi:hypothetical protein